MDFTCKFFIFRDKMSKKEAVLIVGAPGSGKGTQGELLENRKKERRYVMSTLIKKELVKGSETYDRVINKGILLNDLDVGKIFEKYFENEAKVIIDGIPRSKVQAKWLHNFLKNKGYKITVLYIKVDEEKLLERILLRGKKEGRKDDTPVIFKERLKLFDNVINIILKEYDGEIIEINGDQDISKVEEEIKIKFG